MVAMYLQQQEQKLCCSDSVILVASLCGKSLMCLYSEQIAIII
jgi:hypothetical protein